MDFFKTLMKALPLVEAASLKFLDNTERREWAVQELVRTLHVKESLARAAVEFAVLITKTKT